MQSVNQSMRGYIIKNPEHGNGPSSNKVEADTRRDNKGANVILVGITPIGVLGTRENPLVSSRCLTWFDHQQVHLLLGGEHTTWNITQT